MRRLADGGVVHVEITADGAHDDIPRVQPDADLHREAVGSSDTVGVLLY
jgi:hypothetical protein